MRLPNRESSWAVLVGVGEYDTLPKLRGVHAGAARLRGVLIDPEFGSLDPDRCVLLPENASSVEIGAALQDASDKAEDLLLFYFAGHGIRGRGRHDLFLSVASTERNNATFSGLRYDGVRDVVEESNARSKIVILDSCFSGRAIGEQMLTEGEGIIDEVTIEGVAVMTSVPAHESALVRDGEDYPAYTTRMIQVLEQGIPESGEFLTVGDLKRRLRSVCTLDGLRPPQARTFDQVDSLGIVKNKVFVQATTIAMEQQAARLARLEVERQQREDLDLIAQTTELLTDLEYPYALRDIAELLQSMVRWAGFYVNDDGLKHAAGIDVASPPSGRGRRHARYIEGNNIADKSQRRRSQTDALSDSVTTGPMPILEVVDSVQHVLDGVLDGPVTLHLDIPHAPHSASGWLQRDLTLRLADELGKAPDSVAVHPVAGRRDVLGLVVIVPDEDEPGDYVDADEPDTVRTVVEVVARRAGSAIDTARMYAREHQLAETLQRTMLPDQADVAGLDVWTYYAPNAEHAQVGGDWYDVLQISPDLVGLVIGDIVGHDVEAAATMGRLSMITRAYAFEFGDPSVVLERVDQLVAGMGLPRLAAMVYATLRRTSSPGEDGGDLAESWTVSYSRAGHLPPLLLRAEWLVTLADGTGALVGLGSHERTTGEAQLQAGDTLVFYTDGLIKRRERSLHQGFEELLNTASAITARDAAGVGEEFLSRLADAPEDDIAILVVRVPDPAGDAAETALSPRWRRWMLPSEPSSIGRARHEVLRTCQAWGIEESAQAELVVSELVANSVLHGSGHLALRLYDTGDGLRIEVEDNNPAPPVTTDGHPNRPGGFSMQPMDQLADSGWRPSGSGKLVWANVRRA